MSITVIYHAMSLTVLYVGPIYTEDLHLYKSRSPHNTAQQIVYDIATAGS